MAFVINGVQYTDDALFTDVLEAAMNACLVTGGTVTIGPGTFTVTRPLPVVQSVSYFELIGAGASQTKLIMGWASNNDDNWAPGGGSYASALIRVGYPSRPYNSAWRDALAVAAGTQTITATVPENACSCTLSASATASGYMLLADDRTTVNINNAAEQFRTYMELLPATASGTSVSFINSPIQGAGTDYDGTFLSGRPSAPNRVGRAYTTAPRLIFCDSLVTKRVKVQGLTLAGRAYTQTTIAADPLGFMSAGLYVGLSVNVEVSDVFVDCYHNYGVYLAVCRDSTITSVVIGDADSDTAGTGIGIFDQTSRNTMVNSPSGAAAIRTGAKRRRVVDPSEFTGLDSTVFNMTNAFVGGSDVSFAHGKAGVRVHVAKSIFAGDADVGNSIAMSGGSALVMQDCTVGGVIKLFPNTSFTAINVTAAGLQSSAALCSGSSSLAGSTLGPTSLTLTNVTLTGGSAATAPTVSLGQLGGTTRVALPVTAVFTNVAITSASASFGAWQTSVAQQVATSTITWNGGSASHVLTNTIVFNVQFATTGVIMNMKSVAITGYGTAKPIRFTFATNTVTALTCTKEGGAAITASDITRV